MDVTTTEPAAQGSPIAMIIPLIIGLFMIVALWKMYSKGGQPGIACIIPIWNIIALLQIAGKPVWWFILCLIPVVNIVIVFIVWIAVAKNFGKGAGFGVGLALLPIIFVPILAFGSAQYGAAAEAAPAQEEAAPEQ